MITHNSGIHSFCWAGALYSHIPKQQNFMQGGSLLVNTSPSKKLSFMEKFSYGLGDCSANIVVALTGTFLSAYYTDTVGIAAAAVGTMLLLCRVLDGGSDLLMGALVDKTSSKYGKARPWMLWTAPLMAAGIYLLFNCHHHQRGNSYPPCFSRLEETLNHLRCNRNDTLGIMLLRSP